MQQWMCAAVVAVVRPLKVTSTVISLVAVFHVTFEVPVPLTAKGGFWLPPFRVAVKTITVSLQPATTAAHIHCCISPPGNTGVATTTPTFPGFPLGVTSGSYSRTFDMTAASSYNPAFVTAHGGTTAGAAAALLAGLQAGQAYLNIHTTMFPGGEIRGFLQQP